jgi:beta-N-acetylhexosaminidase
MKSDTSGQLLLIGIPGKHIDSETAEVLRRVQPGGFILFGRNIESAAQLRKLIDDLREISDVEPIITIDQEGGRVSRLRLIGNEPPNAQELREKGDVALIEKHGDITGRILRLFGFNLDLCPVLDISFDDEADNSLRGRCYGKTVEQVIRNAGAFNRAMRAQGIASCGKHFPGYSAATLDAHHELPRIDRTLEQLNAEELAVFRAFVGRGGSPNRPPARPTTAETAKSGGRTIEVNRPYLDGVVDSMMICHAWYPSLEPKKKAASLSHRVVTQLLREEMGFAGLVMTDDLDMGAILNEYGLEDTIRRAMEAGNDMAMICHRLPAAEEAKTILESLPAALLDRAVSAVNEFKKKMAPPLPFSEMMFRLVDKEIWDLRVAVLGPERAALRSPEDGKRSPVEIY